MPRLHEESAPSKFDSNMKNHVRMSRTLCGRGSRNPFLVTMVGKLQGSSASEKHGFRGVLEPNLLILKKGL